MSVRCPEDASQWCPMDMAAVYAVALNDFLAEGGARRVYSFEDVIIDRIPGNRYSEGLVSYRVTRWQCEISDLVTFSIVRFIMVYSIIKDDKGCNPWV